MRVAITGVGGSAGMTCIKALKGHKLHGFDCNSLSAGFKFAMPLVVPPAEVPEFFDTLRWVCQKLEVDVLIPTVDEELPIIAERRDELLPCVAVVAPLETVETCLDKQALMITLGKRAPIWRGELPVVVKPAIGRGGRNIYVCRDEDDYNHAVKKCPHPFVIQDYLASPEYSVDTLSDLEGRCLVAVPRERMEIKGGVVWRGRTVDDEGLRSLAKWTVERLKMTGPAVVQIREDKVFEVNPRIGGSTIMSVQAGVNIPELAVKLFTGEEIGDIPAPKEIMMARFFEEAYFP